MADASRQSPKTLVFVTTEDWYFLSHRLALARDAIARGSSVVLASRLQAGAEPLRRAGVETFDLDWRRGGLPNWRDLSAILALCRLYRRIRPDLVHNVALKPVLLGTLAARLAGVPRIVNAVAGLGFLFTAKSLRARCLRGLFLLAARPLMASARIHFLFQNQDDRALLSRLLALPPERTHLVRGAGVDLDRFPPKPPPANSEIVVALVARMLRIKGIDVAVEAVRRLRDDGLAIRLVLVGASDPTNPSAVPVEQLKSWNGRAGISWLGHRDDIAAIWTMADIALLPSQGGEGLPKSLLEAAACGRPLVGTDVAGIRDLVLDGKTGLLVPADDVAALAGALRRLALDPDLRREFGAAARAHVAAHFSEAEVTRAIGALHDALSPGR